ncbi:DUF2889 domain-containing protein [Piscinibacter sp.]|uniref:DUF2889 domain-containing protein n=1 Tax=Piscinibacter sp. TaxID=1903157 RepID=UPI00342CD09C
MHDMLLRIVVNERAGYRRGRPETRWMPLSRPLRRPRRRLREPGRAELLLPGGFRQAVKERPGGVAGCTHITELTQVLVDSGHPGLLPAKRSTPCEDSALSRLSRSTAGMPLRSGWRGREDFTALLVLGQSTPQPASNPTVQTKRSYTPRRSTSTRAREILRQFGVPVPRGASPFSVLKRPERRRSSAARCGREGADPAPAAAARGGR